MERSYEIFGLSIPGFAHKWHEGAIKSKRKREWTRNTPMGSNVFQCLWVYYQGLIR